MPTREPGPSRRRLHLTRWLDAWAGLLRSTIRRERALHAAASFGGRHRRPRQRAQNVIHGHYLEASAAARPRRCRPGATCVRIPSTDALTVPAAG